MGASTRLVASPKLLMNCKQEGLFPFLLATAGPGQLFVLRVNYSILSSACRKLFLNGETKLQCLYTINGIMQIHIPSIKEKPFFSFH